ncbi:TPT domain-containing protein [Mycena sanguinolenta]|uniref:GDP-mannose transporter n=1 Tax=Mycena sanguinolenta TaxID=230812 RepID=A0A8H6ZI01_9AGAR|nr:TPT domain-containing protein [Mycena sanguinolenta]
MQREQEPENSWALVGGVVVFYMVAALVMVFVNKAVLNNTPDLPFTFLFIQCFIALLLLRLVAFANRTSLRRINPIDWELPMVHRSALINLFPYFTVGISGLIFNTLCLTNVDASFFQIARGLALPFTIVVSAVHTRVRPRPQVVVAAFIVTCGFFIGTAPTFMRRASSLSHESAIALFYGSMSSLLLAVHAVLKKPALGHVGNSVMSLAYFGNMFSATMLFMCTIFHGEVGVLYTRYHDPRMIWTPFLVGSAVTGFFGFLLGIANSLSVKASILKIFTVKNLMCVFPGNEPRNAHVLLAKGVIQTLLGVWIFSDVITLLRFYSISTIIGGTIYYTYIQNFKPKIKHPFPKSDLEKQAFPEKVHERL